MIEPFLEKAIKMYSLKERGESVLFAVKVPGPPIRLGDTAPRANYSFLGGRKPYCGAAVFPTEESEDA